MTHEQLEGREESLGLDFPRHQGLGANRLHPGRHQQPLFGGIAHVPVVHPLDQRLDELVIDISDRVVPDFAGICVLNGHPRGGLGLPLGGHPCGHRWLAAFFVHEAAEQIDNPDKLLGVRRQVRHMHRPLARVAVMGGGVNFPAVQIGRILARLHPHQHHVQLNHGPGGDRRVVHDEPGGAVDCVLAVLDELGDALPVRADRGTPAINEQVVRDRALVLSDPENVRAANQNFRGDAQMQVGIIDIDPGFAQFVAGDLAVIADHLVHFGD